MHRHMHACAGPMIPALRAVMTVVAGSTAVECGWLHGPFKWANSLMNEDALLVIPDIAKPDAVVELAI